MPVVDWTIKVSDLLLLGAGLVAFVKVVVTQRDFNRDVLRLLGKARPVAEREGLLGDVETLKEGHEAIVEHLRRHDDYPHPRLPR